MVLTKRFVSILCSLNFLISYANEQKNAKLIITNHHGPSQLGDRVIAFAIAKILSLKYPDVLKFYYSTFGYGDLFVFDDCEEKFTSAEHNSSKIFLYNESEIGFYRDHKNIFLATHIGTILNDIDPSILAQIKKSVQLKQIPQVNDIPKNMITVAVHIRKGNGGGEVYGGELASPQLYDFDRSKVAYVYDYKGTPFDWETYKSLEAKGKEFLDHAQSYRTKFPPEQYYVDQVRKLSDGLGHPPLYVQLFTDDRDPVNLAERIKKAVNLPNVILHYENNRSYSYREQMAQDIHNISRFDVFIRSQSYFARAIELMSNHKLIIHPLESRWEGNILIMTKVAIKGKLSNLAQLYA